MTRRQLFLGLLAPKPACPTTPHGLVHCTLVGTDRRVLRILWCKQCGHLWGTE